MNNWQHGYAADSSYKIHFQAAQTPAHLYMVCALAGVPWRLSDDLCVADLGCGRGFAANALAAANPGWSVFGLDYNPAQVAEAKQLAALSGLRNAHFEATDLAAVSDAEIDRLPMLDVIMVHGLWTWVSDAVREGMVRVLKRRLKPGGLAYFGYNALPAAGMDFALQRLLRLLAAESSATGGAEGVATDDAAAAAHAVSALRALSPSLSLPATAMLKRLLADPLLLEPAFVAHEFLTEHWRPVFHQDLCQALVAARLDFVGSCNLFEALPELFIPPSALQRQKLQIRGSSQELFKDLFLKRSFRADVFMRGRLPPVAGGGLANLLLAAARVLPAASPILGMDSAAMQMPQAQWDILRRMLTDSPQRLTALCQALDPVAPDAAQLLALLVGTGCVLPVFDDPPQDGAARRFNATAAQLYAGDALDSGHMALASTFARGGVAATGQDLKAVSELTELQAASNQSTPGNPRHQDLTAKIRIWQNLRLL